MARERTCVITGATSGIGLETARLFADRGAFVIGVGRDPQRCASAAAAIRDSTGSRNVAFLTADLSSQAAIRELAKEIARLVEIVDVLVNNAGTFTFRRAVSRDGIELQFAVNYLATFLLTGLLMPLLAAAPSARVVTVSSGSHYSGRINWKDVMLARGYNGLRAYSQSKLATVLFTAELARRLGPDAGISTCAVDPGLVRTEIGLKGGGWFVRFAWRIRSRRGIEAEQAASSVVFCADGRDTGIRSGRYWKDCSEKSPARAAQSATDASRLWELSERLCGLRYP
ncbi:MAG TPA: SDR family NAD(P)-dependent oxidoreductase [Spirochaetia bacterium]|nr:SDR family NAD(P)-dependent oxidoreductase [Spirochaetia bacterium]